MFVMNADARCITVSDVETPIAQILSVRSILNHDHRTEYTGNQGGAGENLGGPMANGEVDLGVCTEY